MNDFLFSATIWDILTAIGTIGAVFVSLWVTIDSAKEKITLLIAPDGVFLNHYELTLLKNIYDYFVIKEVGIIYKHKKIPFSNSYKNMEILNQKNEVIDFKVPFAYADGHLRKVSLEEVDLTAWYGKKIRFYVKDFEDNIFKTKKVTLTKLKSKK